MKKQITKEEHLTLIGLLTLAKQHAQMLDDIRKSICDVIDLDVDHSDEGHVSDAIYGDPIVPTASLSQMLRRLKIGIERKRASGKADK